MTAIRINRTHLAILLSLIGVGLPWHQVARAQGEMDARVASSMQVEAHEAAIRSVLGLNGADSMASRAVASGASIDQRTKITSRAVASRESATSRWDAAALGLDRVAHVKTEAATEDRGHLVRADVDRMRSILGLDPEPILAGVMAPLKDALRRPAGPSMATARATDPSTATGAIRQPLARLGAPAMAEADAIATVATDRPEPTEFVSLIPEVDAIEFGADALLRAGESDLPQKRHEREPASAIASANQIVRRSNLVTTATLSLPPEDVESLDETLRIRLRGQFRLLDRDGTLPSSTTSTSDASTDDALLALLQVLSNRDEDHGRSAPIIFVATAPQDPRVAVISADVFRHVAESIEQWSADATVAVASVVVSPEPPAVTALPGVAIATSAVAAASSDRAPTAQIALFESTPVLYVEAPGSRAPMLPMNPFAWHGDDAIDLSVSLANHPLLVASSIPPDLRAQSMQMVIALRQPPAVKSSTHRAMTALVDIFDPQLALAVPMHMVIALREPPVVAPMDRRLMTDLVDIFDPALALAADLPPRRATGGPAASADRLRPAVTSDLTLSSVAVEGERDTIVAARERQAVATPARTVTGIQVPMVDAQSPPTPHVLVHESEPQVAPAVMFEADENRLSALQGNRVALADSRLEEMRGGFETDAGLKISFGIERAVYINGILVTSTSLNVADLNKFTAGQVQTMGLDRSTLGIIQSGPNNTFSPGQLGSSSAATVIQNTLNDQRIQGITQINATVNSLDLIRKMSIQQNIQSALADSIRH